MPVQSQAYGLTDIGRRRDRNEDSYFIDEALQLYIVCDGMGGHAAGDVASDRAVQFVSQYIRDRKTVIDPAVCDRLDCGRVVRLVEEAVEGANENLFDFSSSDPNCAGMGTTITLLLLCCDKGFVAHVGDTRLYLLRQDEPRLLTTDHTLANTLVLTGILRPDDAEVSQMANLLTRSVGQHPTVRVDSSVFDVLPGDTYLLCSDGLSRYFPDSEELTRCLKHTDLATIPRELVGLANSRGGRDNISAVVVRPLAVPREPCPGVQSTGPGLSCLTANDQLNGTLHAGDQLPAADAQ